jgi:hypothetical protein
MEKSEQQRIVLWKNRRSGYKAGYNNGWNDAIDACIRGMDDINDDGLFYPDMTRKKLESLKSPQKEQKPQ